ncbi:MAG: YicC family protein [Gammaproteobacteria bacterium]|nr:YicC family protein [Gammaproteobacteria bacterium]
MTGYARREGRGEWGTLIWECRSVNHRYLEIQLRLPEEFRALEADIRELLGQRVKRGKLDCYLRLDKNDTAQRRLEVNTELAEQLIDAAGRISSLVGNQQNIDTASLLRWPGVVCEAEPDQQQLREAALALLSELLDDFVATRKREGGRIADLLLERSAAVADIVDAVRRRIPEVRARIRDKLISRLDELDTDADQHRIEQEIVYIAQRLDVDEELDRLNSHIAELRNALTRDEPVGRRLDFLMQEFNREANTLGSKSQDTETTRAAVDLKVLIEQMREQIQNVE